MKTFKGLFLFLGLTLIAFTGTEANSDSTIIKKNIFAAIYNIDYTSINILLSEGTDINQTNRNGDTPLMIAAKIGNLRILDIILSHNPDINKYNKAGKTALIIAAESGQLNVVEKLLAHNADVSLKDSNDYTALTLASKYGHKKVVDYLKNMRTQPTLAKYHYSKHRYP